MKLRILTVLGGLAIFLPFLFVGGAPFSFFVLLLSLISFYEWVRLFTLPFVSLGSGIAAVMMVMILSPHLVPGTFFDWMNAISTSIWVYYIGMILLLALMILKPKQYNLTQILSLGFGALYLGFGYRYLIATRALGPIAILYIVLIVYTNDSCAYFVGRRWGKHPLAPLVSPKKTIEGSIGGIVGAIIVTTILALVIPQHEPLIFVLSENALFTLILAVVGQIGDLVESSIKRYCGVKNSGNLLPGHGGLLDRFDNMLLVLPVFHLLMFLLS